MKPHKFSISEILTRSPKGPQQETALERDEETYSSLHSPQQSQERNSINRENIKSPDVNQNNAEMAKPEEKGLKRKRDPIGQILDSLGTESVNSSPAGPSAFSPIITSAATSHLSPLSLLAQTERRCIQSSPVMSYSPYQRQTVMSPEHYSVEQLSNIQAQQNLFHQNINTHYMFQPEVQQNLQYMYYMQDKQAQLMTFEAQNRRMSERNFANSIPEQQASLPLWVAWLKSYETSSYVGDIRIPPPPRYQCDACKKSYSTFGGLSKHKQFHCVSNVKKEFNCKYCEKSYGSLGALKMHIRTHTLPCKCKLCGKAFSRPWLLQGHVRTHTGEKPFKCLHCARAFADRSNLRAHLQTHSDIKKYGCKNCTKTFSRMSLLLKHEDGSCLGIRR